MSERRGRLEMALHQFRFDELALIRNRQATFFTFALPVMFLVIFASIFGGHDHTVRVAGGRIHTSVFYVPGIMTLGVIAGSFVNLVIVVTAQRETGVLKRRRATPVPASTIILGRALSSVVTALINVIVLLAVGWAVFGAHVPARSAPALAVSVVVGSLSFCCLGYAVASLVHDQDAAQPVTQAVMLPLYFISGVFIAGALPTWLVDVSDAFPVRHLASAILNSYNPHIHGAGFAWTDLLVVAAWGVAGLMVAVRRFTWLPVASRA